MNKLLKSLIKETISKISKYLIFLPGQALLDNAMPNRRIRNPKVEWHTKTCNIKMNVK